jgi:hypothetical protein
MLANVVTYNSWSIDDMIALGNPTRRDKPPREVADFVSGGLLGGIHNPIHNAVALYADEWGRSS